MSQQNLEIVREMWRAFTRGEFPAEAFADEVEWHTAADLPDRETCVGREAIQKMLAVGWENVIDSALEVEELLDAGERVLVRWRGSATGRSSDAPIDWREAHPYELRGTLVGVHEHRGWPEALRAAGLNE